MSDWLSQVDASGQPRHAVTFVYLFGAAILCAILPSQVAFTSLVSAGGIPTIAAYGLIALLRLTMTPNGFKKSYFYLGKYRRIFYVVAALFNALVFAVSFLPKISPPVGITRVQVMISPFTFPVTSATFNFVSPAIRNILGVGLISLNIGMRDIWCNHHFRCSYLVFHT